MHTLVWICIINSAHEVIIAVSNTLCFLISGITSEVHMATSHKKHLQLDAIIIINFEVFFPVILLMGT